MPVSFEHPFKEEIKPRPSSYRRVMSAIGGSQSGRILSEDKSRQQKFLSFHFYQAVRDRKPVWMLEDMRTMETFHWEEDASQRSYTPSEALLYAIVHDHQAYAQHLLGHYSQEALAMPGERFGCCPSSAPHLAMAVRYDRRDILRLILRVAHGLPTLRSYMNRSGCFHLQDGRTPLHQACELLRCEAVILLLGSGASPQAVDSNGLTPLDVVLEQLWDSEVNVGAKKFCLDNLLLFMSEIRFKMKESLKKDPACWTKILGEEKFYHLIGKNPAPLLLLAMQKILGMLPPEQFPKSLHDLPIPTSLKLLPVSPKLRVQVQVL